MVSNIFVRHVSYGVSYKVIRHVGTVGHVSDDFVRHVSDKTLVSDIPLLPLGTWVLPVEKHQRD